MAKVEQANRFVELKQRSNVDVRQKGPLVTDRDEQVSVASQQVINLAFSTNLDQKELFFLYIDGSLVREGSASDYEFTNIVSNTSAQVTLTSPLGVTPVNIIATKIGQQVAQFPNPSTVQATLNNDVAQPLPWAEKGFKNFVCEEFVTAPFTSIVNRAQVRDTGLASIFGIERVHFNTFSLLSTEFGAVGEKVFGPGTKDSRVRVVGSGWTMDNNSQGNSFNTAVIGDYIEVTFYGTGLNILFFRDTVARTWDVDVDTSFVKTIGQLNGNGVLSNRGHRMNLVENLTSGLSLGFHTVKITKADANQGWLFGFEVLNELTQLKINTGIAFAGTKKEELLSTFDGDFDAGVAGIRGARVIKYILNGTISQAVQEVNGSQGNLGSADHTNEEVLRRINWREFGSNRADDFSTLSTTDDVAFTLDDGTTTLVANDVDAILEATGDNLRIITTNGFVILNFIGTGLDFINPVDSFGMDTEVTVDGSVIGTGTGTISGLGKIKVVSGLPYGSHTVKIERLDASGSAVRFQDFIIYGPKKPTLPAGAIELADYNVMADFVANTTSGQLTISTGTLRKMGMREFTYQGTWVAATIDPINFLHGFNMGTVTSGDSVSYTFFGTGFDMRFFGAAAAQDETATVTVDGASNLSAFTTSVYGAGIVFTDTTGVLDQLASSSLPGCGLIISGLTLGLHTVELTLSTPAETLRVDTFDVITPIHINNSKVGSLALLDKRCYSPIPKAELGVDLAKAKAWILYDGAANLILSSFNISAVIDDAVGQWILFFEKGFKDAKYVMGGSGSANITIGQVAPGASKNPGWVKMRSTVSSTGADADSTWSAIFYGELENEGES